MNIRSKRLRIVVSLVVGLALLVVWLRVIDLQRALEIIQNIRPEYGVLWAIAFILSHFVRSQRWKLVFSPVGTMKRTEAFNLYMGGVALNFLFPIRAGEIAKSVLLRQLRGTPISKSMATIVVDRTLDLSPVLFVLVAIPLFHFVLSPGLLAIVLSVVVLLLGVTGATAAAIFFRTRSTQGFERVWTVVPGFLREKLSGVASSFADALSASTTSPSLLVKALVLTFLAAVFNALCYFFIYRAIGYPLPFFTALLGFILFEMSFVLPTPPGQIGSTEVLLLLIFSATLGVPADIVSASVLIAHPLTAVMVVAIGSICLNALGFNLANALGADNARTGAGGAKVQLDHSKEVSDV